MGHFGRAPIRAAWFVVVLPALLLNYFGQGALILSRPDEATHSFFHLAPSIFQYPLIGLSTVATIIASQAVITGTFSLTAQAVRLELLPRMRIVHTSAHEHAQVYVPLINWLLMLATIALVLGFQTSDRLAAAYGLAVSADMAITTVLAATLAWRYGGRYRSPLAGLALCIWLVDWVFFGANTLKFLDGGWYPVLVGVLIYAVIASWQRGRRRVAATLEQMYDPDRLAIATSTIEKLPRVPGTALFFADDSRRWPPTLTQHLLHHHVLQETVILLSITVQNRPRVAATDRLLVTTIAPGIYHLRASYGYLQHPNAPLALRLAESNGLKIDLEQVTYYFADETLDSLSSKSLGEAVRDRLFSFLARNASRPSVFYKIPSHQVVQLGIGIDSKHGSDW